MNYTIITKIAHCQVMTMCKNTDNMLNYCKFKYKKYLLFKELHHRLCNELLRL